MRRAFAGFLFLLLPLRAIDAPAACRQLVLGVAKDWNSSHVTLALYQKDGKAWKRTLAPWQGRLGKNGLAWGMGLHSAPKNVTLKREGDMRTPAGLFRIGGAWGYEANIQRHASLPYRQVTSRDLWVEDVASPSYNRHLILDHEPSTAWEKKHQMKQNDAAHALKLFIAHNAPPRAKAGAGSSIFFHIWRKSGASATAGCTTMSPGHLRALIARIDPALQPCYLILPEAEMAKIRLAWRLP
jgi:L,D-peptidoglycan transpeptidase YkuD (ErfK/YbiS/YcfS/YnhG family)